MTPARRFIVRTSLVTGSTIATIVGAQSLALLDLQANSQAEPIADPTQAVNTANAEAVNTAAAPTIITDSAPSIAIIRRPASQTNTTTTNAAPNVSTNTSAGTTTSVVPQSNPVNTQIVPPSPVQSQPVTISMPQQPTTRSSR